MGDNMKERYIRRIVLVASVFTAFVAYLCLSCMDIKPLLLIIALCTTTVTLGGLVCRTYAGVKQYTQKTE